MAVGRPALVYGAETLAFKEAQVNQLEVAEMRSLRWMCRVTKLDKKINERMRGTTKVGGGGSQMKYRKGG